MASRSMRTVFTVAAVALLWTRAFAGYKRVPFIVHVQSTRSSDGLLSLDQIARAARADGIAAVIFNDHDLMKWEYGMFPLRHILKRTVRRVSVLSSGPERYLDEIARLNRAYPDLLLIPGVEAAPFYYWTGRPFGGLTINNWHKHLLVAGLYRPGDYRRLPLVGNESGGGTPDYRLLWPVALLLFGCFVLNRYRALGMMAALAGILFTINNYPFKRLPFDQYHGDRGDLPYQYLIDYVARAAPDTGMVFWAHPESPNFNAQEKAGTVSIRTPRYPDSLLHTDGYTGFGYFQEGELTAGRPGGIWDRVLTDHARGKRKTPVWAISELDFRKDGYNGTYMNSFKNILFLPAQEPLSGAALIRGIRAGRFYALRKQEGSFELILDELSLTDGVRAVTMGETLHSSRPLRLIASLRASDNAAHPLILTVVSNGRIINSIQAKTPACVRLPLPPRGGRTYYRIEIESTNAAKIVANPLFAG